MRSVAGGIDGMEAVFDDGSLVGDGGLLLAGTVMHRLGLEALIDNTEVCLSLPRGWGVESNLSFGFFGVVEMGSAVVVEPGLAGLL